MARHREQPREFNRASLSKSLLAILGRVFTDPTSRGEAIGLQLDAHLESIRLTPGPMRWAHRLDLIHDADELWRGLVGMSANDPKRTLSGISLARS